VNNPCFMQIIIWPSKFRSAPNLKRDHTLLNKIVVSRPSQYESLPTEYRTNYLNYW